MLIVMKIEVKGISPMLAVADMEETVTFYCEVLGFRALMTTEAYSVIERDGCEIHLSLAADSSVLEAVRGRTSIYVKVEGIESLWKEVDAKRGDYRVKDLFEQPYGMREFHIEDPNCCLVFVGEKIS